MFIEMEADNPNLSGIPPQLLSPEVAQNIGPFLLDGTTGGLYCRRKVDGKMAHFFFTGSGWTLLMKIV